MILIEPYYPIKVLLNDIISQCILFEPISLYKEHLLVNIIDFLLEFLELRVQEF